MNISTRAENMPQSPIRKLAKYSDAAKRNGIHVYHLNIGQPDILTPPCAIEAVHNMDRSILDYSPSQVARRYCSHSWHALIRETKSS